ncbi:MAG TPA: DUF4129 domain-containing protein [Glaciihabitans sp.]|jgi:hypothetical protein|nr:DUF4129 domain-containing protein [Glaciihabitans sp.]
MTPGAVASAVHNVPIDPSPDEARRWILLELAKAKYEAARPSWFDRIADAIVEWFQSLQFGAPGGPSALGILVLLGAFVLALGIAFAIFGLPRLRRRSEATGELFGDADVRDSLTLVSSAERAAASGDYTTATVDMFRALARGLSERVIVRTSPGTTAHGFARSAGDAFPASRAELDRAANAFDEVRYLGHTGTADSYAAVAELERQLRSARVGADSAGTPANTAAVPR